MTKPKPPKVEQVKPKATPRNVILRPLRLPPMKRVQ